VPAYGVVTGCIEKSMLDPLPSNISGSTWDMVAFHIGMTLLLYRPSDRVFSAKLVPTFANRGCHAFSMTDPFVRILGFIDRDCYFFLKVAPQLYSRV
jgi:hypothetical protein